MWPRAADQGKWGWIGLLLAMVLLTSILPFTAIVPATVGYVLSLGALVAFTWVCTVRRRWVVVRPVALLTLGVIWLVYAIHLLHGAATGTLTVDEAMRTPVFILGSIVFVFVVPSVLPRIDFTALLSRVVAVVVVIGLPTAVLGGYGVGGIAVRPWHEPITLPVLGLQFHTVTSVFANPNPFGILSAMGLFAAVAEFWRTRSPTALALAGVGLLGVGFSASRTAAVATVFGIGVLGAALLVDDRQFDLLVGAGWVGLGVVLAMLLGLLPALGPLAHVDLTGRDVLWTGAAHAVSHQPILGYGPGETGALIAPFVDGRYSGFSPHNSYVRLFVTTGLVGGVAYLVFVGWALWRTWDDAPWLAMTSALAVSQIFSSYSLFGISVLSVVAAIVFGYAALDVDPTDRADSIVTVDTPQTSRSQPGRDEPPPVESGPQ